MAKKIEKIFDNPLYQKSYEALVKWSEMPLEDRLESLKKMGILDKNGKLSKKYGGQK